MITIDNIANYLKDDELYIDYVDAGFFYLFTLNNKKQITFKRVNEKLKDPYTIFVDSIGKNIFKKYKKLIISKDGILHKIQFESLKNRANNKYLIEEKEIVYIPSAKEFIRLHNKKKENLTNSGNIVVFSNPNYSKKAEDKRGVYLKKGEKLFRNKEVLASIRDLFNSGFSMLYGTKMESRYIKNIFRKKVKEYSYNDANEDNLFKISSPKILHLATHGFFIPDSNLNDSSLKSGIVLSGVNSSIDDGESVEGIVTASNLLNLNLKGTELVVFSACKTGRGDIKKNEGVDGLSRAMFQAGANNVIVTLWKVSDRESALFMKLFYQFVNKGQSYSKALQLTKIEMIMLGFEPYYWAAFILIGNGDFLSPTKGGSKFSVSSGVINVTRTSVSLISNH